MKAIILAAGEAKRLRPITENIPKCMLKIGPQSIIDYQIDNLLKSNINNIVVVTGFLAEKLESHLLKKHKDVNFTFIRSEEYYKTYPAHGLWLAKKYMDDDIIYLNADVICHPYIISEIVSSNFNSVTALHKNNWDEEQVNIITEANSGNVLEMGKHISRELSSGEFIGVTKMSKAFNQELIKVLDNFIAKNELKKFAADAINITIQRGQLMHGVNLTHLAAIEVDTLDDLIEAQTKIEQL